LSIGEAHDARGEANDVARVARSTKPTIAAINGFALGGGLELAMACDIRIAAEGALLGLPEVSRGTLPGNGGTQRLPRLIGYASAMELILTGAQIPAEDALRLGLISRVVPSDRLLGEAQEMGERIAANGPLAVRYAKEAIRATLELPLKAGLEYESALSLLMLGSDDRREGIAAFREKRTPNWTGR
jgi:enoyl-CoA hydratase/carnithine racemase